MKKDEHFLLTVLENFVGQNWAAFISFARDEHGEEFSEENFDAIMANIKKEFD